MGWRLEAERLLQRTLLALMVLALLGVLLAPWSGPADAATTFTVNRTGDAPDRRISDTVCDTSRDRGTQCTLRAAIQESNDTLGADAINFNIGDTTSVKTITPASPLPDITETVTIDGYTQPGASENTLPTSDDAVLKVQLNGANAGSNADGLVIQASDSTIKGLVINRFKGGGVEISGPEASFNRVEGNFIGTNASGTTDLGTFLQGVIVSGAPDNTVGGTEPRARNVLSGSSRGGVLISGAEATRNKVEGNFIGTDASGTADLGNNGSGVRISNAADDNTVGGTTGGARNVISGTSGDGVFISETFGTTDLATGNEVLGNFIGTTADGRAALGNNNAGVTISSGASNTTVGGTASGAGNRIAHNGKDGVSIFESVGNRVLSNSIFSNGSTANDLGIDLDFTGVTENDTDDPDVRANNRQNFPRISSAMRSGSTLTVSGTLNSNPSQNYTIQCFVAVPDPSGHGEGQIPVGGANVTTNSGGDASFSCVSPVPQLGQAVTATATNTATGDTSEFSQNRTIVSGP